MAETKSELEFKEKHNLGEHVRVSIKGARPTRTVPPKGQGQANEIKGFGDVIATWTKAMGITPCAGCRKRRQALNRVFPFRAKG